MAIADVARLKSLRNRLFKYIWQSANSLDSIEFTIKRANHHETQTLDAQEKEDLNKVLGIGRLPEAGWTLSECVGHAVRAIVLNRLDIAIKKAARDAEDEAREVLKILEND